MPNPLHVFKKERALFVFLMSLLYSCAGDQPRDPAGSSVSSLSSSSEDLLTDENATFSGSIEEQIKKYQQVISERNIELDYLRNSEDKLSKMILLNGSRGCMLDKKIENLEISIGGGNQPDRDHGTKSDKKSSKGNPDEIVIEFAPGISVSTGGNGFFSNKNHSTGSLSSYRLADIAYVKFLKDGIKYDNKRVCKKVGGFLGIGAREECKYEVVEKNLWFLSEVKIKVNGTLIYDRGSINHDFDGDRSEWKDNNLKENRAYIEMLSKVSCE
jgi:hypothetical protein